MPTDASVSTEKPTATPNAEKARDKEQEVIQNLWKRSVHLPLLRCSDFSAGKWGHATQIRSRGGHSRNGRRSSAASRWQGALNCIHACLCTTAIWFPQAKDAVKLVEEKIAAMKKAEPQPAAPAEEDPAEQARIREEREQERVQNLWKRSVPIFRSFVHVQGTRM